MNERRSSACLAILVLALLPVTGRAAPGDTTADRVLGQTDFVSADSNPPDGGGLSAPAAVAVDSSNRLYVVDSNNNRVLGWANATTFTNGALPDLIIGQPTADAVDCNQASGPSASTLCNPIGVAVDGAGNLFVADAFNNRVLEYDSPFTSGGVADRVFGQGGSFATTSCNTNGIDAGSLCFPVSLALDSAGNLYVKDAGNNRVLEYDAPIAGDALADRVFGQSGSFATNLCNQGGPLGPDVLCASGGVVLDPLGELFIADAGNSRILKFADPLASSSPSFPIGQGTFVDGACNEDGGPTADRLCDPSSLGVDAAGNLFAADFGNNRVLVYLDPGTIDTTADFVFGQNGSFNTGDCASPSADALCGPTGVAIDSLGNVYVADNEYNRVLAFDNPLSLPTPTPTFGPSPTPTFGPSPTPTPTVTSTPTSGPPITPGPSPTATPPFGPTSTPTQGPSPTPDPDSDATTEAPVRALGSEDETVVAGRFDLHNRSSVAVGVSCAAIDFGRPEFFDTAIIVGASGAFNRRAKAVPARPSEFCFVDPLVLEPGGTATFELTVGLVGTPEFFAGRPRVVLAGLTPARYPGWLDVIGIVFLAAAAPSRRKRALVLAMLLAAAALQASCGDDDDTAVPTRPVSTQRLTAVTAAGPNGSFTFAGLPLVLGTVTIPEGVE